MKGPGVVLRSKTPDGLVQEIGVLALLCAYHAVREPINAAALARQTRRGPALSMRLTSSRPGPAGNPGPISPLPR